MHIVDGDLNWYSHYGKHYVGSSKNITLVIIGSRISLLSIYPKKFKYESHRDTCTPMLSATLFKIANIKQPKYPLMNKWIRKLWSIHIIKYDLALKKKKEILFSTTWMDLEGISLCEISQTQKEKFCVISRI